MKKILLLSGILTVCFGYSQKSFEAYKDFSALSGTWKTEVEGSPLILQIREAGKTFRFSLINVNKEEFIIDESELSSPAPSEYEVKVKKAYFIQYTDCSIKNARIHLKKLEDGKLAFSYISDETYCSFGNDNEIDISDVEDLIFTK